MQILYSLAGLGYAGGENKHAPSLRTSYCVVATFAWLVVLGVTCIVKHVGSYGRAMRQKVSACPCWGVRVIQKLATEGARVGLILVGAKLEKYTATHLRDLGTQEMHTYAVDGAAERCTCALRMRSVCTACVLRVHSVCTALYITCTCACAFT